MLRFLTLILICQLAGELAASALVIPVPGPVIGMGILFIGLLIHGQIPKDLGKVADALITHLSLLFVPAGAGIMLHFNLIGDQMLPLSIALVSSTLLAIAVTALFMNWLSRTPKNQRRDEKS